MKIWITFTISLWTEHPFNPNPVTHHFIPAKIIPSPRKLFKNKCHHEIQNSLPRYKRKVSLPSFLDTNWYISPRNNIKTQEQKFKTIHSNYPCVKNWRELLIEKYGNVVYIPYKLTEDRCWFIKFQYPVNLSLLNYHPLHVASLSHIHSLLPK